MGQQIAVILGQHTAIKMLSPNSSELRLEQASFYAAIQVPLCVIRRSKTSDQALTFFGKPRLFAPTLFAFKSVVV